MLLIYYFVNLLFNVSNAHQLPSHPRCYEIASALNPRNLTKVPCGWDSPNIQRRAPAGSSSSVIIDLTCDDVSGKCSKVRRAFDKAAQVLSSFIDFKQPITIQAKFYSFCKVDFECSFGSNSSIILGSTVPSKVITLLDSDNVERLYPQALVKQLDLPKDSVPAFKPIDIIASFNSGVNFWFEEDANIKAEQYDFFSVIAHEIVHGMGFASSLNTWFDKGDSIVTPTPTYEHSTKLGYGLVRFNPSALDRLIITTKDNESIQALMDLFLNFKSNDRVILKSDLVQIVKKSSIYSHTQKLYDICTTPNSLAILLPGGEPIVLETSYSTFQPGSSVSHVANSYTGTKESLMVAKVKAGYDLQGEWGTAPYGPQLVAILGELGYSVKGYSRTSEPPRGRKENGGKNKDSESGFDDEYDSDDISYSINIHLNPVNIHLISILLSIYFILD